jgi:hypothetical protein
MKSTCRTYTRWQFEGHRDYARLIEQALLIPCRRRIEPAQIDAVVKTGGCRHPATNLLERIFTRRK